jgi:hypothetical protein
MTQLFDVWPGCVCDDMENSTATGSDQNSLVELILRQSMSPHASEKICVYSKCFFWAAQTHLK